MKDGGTAKLEAVSYLNKNTLDTKQLQPEDAMRLNEKPNDGGPAFPRPYADDQHTPPDAEYKQAQPGMSLLDLFAGQVIGAIHSSSRRMAEYYIERERTGLSVEHIIAIDAYYQAEEMLHERERRMKK